MTKELEALLTELYVLIIDQDIQFSQEGFQFFRHKSSVGALRLHPPQRHASRNHSSSVQEADRTDQTAPVALTAWIRRSATGAASGVAEEGQNHRAEASVGIVASAARWYVGPLISNSLGRRPRRLYPGRWSS